MQLKKKIYLEIYVKRPKKYIFFGQEILSLCERIPAVKKNIIIAKICIFIVRRNWQLFRDKES